MTGSDRTARSAKINLAVILVIACIGIGNYFFVGLLIHREANAANHTPPPCVASGTMTGIGFDDETQVLSFSSNIGCGNGSSGGCVLYYEVEVWKYNPVSRTIGALVATGYDIASPECGDSLNQEVSWTMEQPDGYYWITCYLTVGGYYSDPDAELLSSYSDYLHLGE